MLALLAFLLESCLLLLRGLGDLRSNVVETVALLVSSSLFYLLSLWYLQAPHPARRQRLWLVLGAALLFRITVWPLFPAFSDDTFRYRWEGMLIAHGGNPYQVSPDDPKWASLRDETWRNIPVREARAVYGPLVEAANWLTYETFSGLPPFSQVFWFKLPAALFDLGIIGALLALLAARRLPLEMVAVYAWSPLPIFEFWATGHNDSLTVFLIVLALALHARSHPWLAAASLTAAAAAKFWPVLLLPLLAPALGLSAPALPVFAVTVTWLPDPRFLSGFLGGWRNNDSLFQIILWVIPDPNRAKRVALAAVIAIALFVATRRWRLEAKALVVMTALLLISANVHPWYLSWFLPLLALYPLTPLLMWTALMPLTYAVLLRWYTLGEWAGSTPVRWFVYAPVFAWSIALLLRHFWLKQMDRSPLQ